MLAHSGTRHLFARARLALVRRALARAISCALALCASPPAQARAQAPDAAPLLAADRALALRAGGGIGALASASTADVVLLYPGAQVERGSTGVTRLLDSIAVVTHDRLTWSPARIEISTDGRRGYAYGRGIRTTSVGGRDSSSGIRYVTWWRRDDAGTWQPAAWLLVDERGAQGRGGASAAAPWPCRTPTSPRFASRVSPRMSADATTEVIAADSTFASRSAAVGAAIAFAEYVADDGISIGASGAPACGKHDVGAELDGAAPSALEWSPIIGDASGDLGYTVGTATIRGERGVHYSKYLTVWKRQPDGAWRFIVDGGNAAPARLATFTAQR